MTVFHPVCRLRAGTPLVRGHGAFGRGRDKNARSYRYLLYPVSLLRGANRISVFIAGYLTQSFLDKRALRAAQEAASASGL